MHVDDCCRCIQDIPVISTGKGWWRWSSPTCNFLIFSESEDSMSRIQHQFLYTVCLLILLQIMFIAAVAARAASGNETTQRRSESIWGEDPAFPSCYPGTHRKCPNMTTSLGKWWDILIDHGIRSTLFWDSTQIAYSFIMFCPTTNLYIYIYIIILLFHHLPSLFDPNIRLCRSGNCQIQQSVWFMAPAVSTPRRGASEWSGEWNGACLHGSRYIHPKISKIGPF